MVAAEGIVTVERQSRLTTVLLFSVHLVWNCQIVPAAHPLKLIATCISVKSSRLLPLKLRELLPAYSFIIATNDFPAVEPQRRSTG